MCTRASSASVPDSFHAVITSIVAVATAVLALVVAVATAPWRAATSQPTRHGKPASTAHIAIQVHLDDGGRVRAIERSCRDALKRAARTWAPFPLPLDRVEVNCRMARKCRSARALVSRRQLSWRLLAPKPFRIEPIAVMVNAVRSLPISCAVLDLRGRRRAGPPSVKRCALIAESLAYRVI